MKRAVVVPMPIARVKYGCRREAGIAPKLAQSKASVTDHRFEPVPSPHVATLLSEDQVIAEASLRGVVSLRWRKAVLDLFLRAQLAVQAHLLLKVSIELRATKQHPEPSADFT